MEYLLGIDLGTSGTKTVLFDTAGQVAASHTVEYPLRQPRNGWAEQEPHDWWRAVRETIQAVLAKSGTDPAAIRGVGISGQMHGLVMLDAQGPCPAPRHPTGAVTYAAAEATGLAPGTPVVGGAGDNAAAAIGTGAVETGKAFTTLGTSGVIFAHADEVTIDPQGRVHSFCPTVPGKWTVMSCTLAAGLSLQWFRNQFCAAKREAASAMGSDPYELMTAEAARSPIGANRLINLPYLMGERSPLLDSGAWGASSACPPSTRKATWSAR